MPVLFKVVGPDGYASDDGYFYDLPKLAEPGAWSPRVVAPRASGPGYKLTTSPAGHVAPRHRLFVAEYQGAIDAGDPEHVAVESVRLVMEVTPSWPLLGAFPAIRVFLASIWRLDHEDEPWPSWADLSRTDLIRLNLAGARLQGATLAAAWLSGADLSESDLAGANLARASLQGTVMHRCDLSRARLDGARLPTADLTRATAHQASFDAADLRRAALHGADLTGARLRWVNLRGAWLSDANLSHTDLHGADLSACGLAAADLVSAKLTDTNLRYARLDGADLTDADLTGAVLVGADLTGARLTGARGFTLPQGWRSLSDGTVLPSSAGQGTLDAARLPPRVEQRLLRGGAVAAEVAASTPERMAWIHVIPTNGRFRLRLFEYDRATLRHLRTNALEFEDTWVLGQFEISVIGVPALTAMLRQWLSDLDVLGEPAACGYPM